MSTNHNETITILGTGSAHWTPAVGPEAEALLSHLPLSPDEKDTVRDEAAAILGRCKRPYVQSDASTGLAIGYVQSGKTMSFTTVAALARDNNYQLILVITGTSIPLFNQSRDRLETDLRLRTRVDRSWQHLSNPQNRASVREVLESTFVDWADPLLSKAEKRTVLITAMKNVTHLRKLTGLLSAIDLRNVPAIVIDDEADQAGMNTMVQQNDESSTYRELNRLRNSLPDHTYLQYTATPQAPLLINIIDSLSPDFAQVLTPGTTYVGGKEYFIERPELVTVIPTNEVPSRGNVLTEPPPTLLEAFRVFLVGVATGLFENGDQGNRSMLVHPSQETLRHAQYRTWLLTTKANWLEVLNLSADDPDAIELREDFHSAWVDLASTYHMPPFDEVVLRLPRALRITRIEEVNAARGATPQILWRDNFSFVLVGGQAMDRGFTVEGLTVTYMPRGVGVGNADTIQQRARFFGYKRPYLGLCRVYLEMNVRDAFKSYVEHEEDVRKQLLRHGSSGRPLSEWKRAFFLNTQLRPTRANVMSLDYMRGGFSDEWWWPKAPHEGENAPGHNRTVVEKFLQKLSLTLASGDPRRTPAQRHSVSERFPLRLAYESLLTALKVPRPADSQKFTGLLLQISAHLDEHPDAEAVLYDMSQGRSRHRTLDPHGEIPTLFQGANYAGDETVYPGDGEIRASNALTIQIHTLELEGANGATSVDVKAVAVFVPANMERQWLVQEGS